MLASSVTSQVGRRTVEVRLRNQLDDVEHVVHAVAVPTICPNVANTEMNSDFVKHLQKFCCRLADERAVPQELKDQGISLLVGSDQLWTIMRRSRWDGRCRALSANRVLFCKHRKSWLACCALRHFSTAYQKYTLHRFCRIYTEERLQRTPQKVVPQR